MFRCVSWDQFASRSAFRPCSERTAHRKRTIHLDESEVCSNHCGAVLATVLPISSVDMGAVTITEGAWTGSRAGPVLLGGLGLIGLFAALAAATRVRRIWTVPMVLFGGLLSFIATTMVQGFSFEKALEDGTAVSGTPGIGLLVILLVFAATATFGIYGTVKPEPRELSGAPG